MGWFGGLVSFASSAISVVSSFISASVSAVGSAIGTFARTLIAEFPKLETWKTVLECIVKAVEWIADLLGVKTEKEDAEEIGLRAQESDKKLEDFDSVQEYIDYLRNEVKIDKEKMQNMKPEERIANVVIGSAILTKGIEEKLQYSIPADFLIEVGKQKMTGAEVKDFIDNFKASGLSLDLSSFLKGKLSESEHGKVQSVIEQTLQKQNPGISQEALDEKISEMMQISRDDKDPEKG